MFDEKVLITPRSFPSAGEKAYKLLREQGFEIIDNKPENPSPKIRCLKSVLKLMELL